MDGPVPQIQEKIVEVMKVILREQCQRVLFFLLTAFGTAHSHTRELAYFDSVWEGGCGLHAKSVCCPTAHPHTRGLILSASDGIRNMLFSTYSHTLKTGKIKWFLLQSSLSLLSWLRFLHFVRTVCIGCSTVCCR